MIRDSFGITVLLARIDCEAVLDAAGWILEGTAGVGGVLTIAIVLAPVDPLLLATNIGGMFGGRCGFSEGGFHVVGDNLTLNGARIRCLSRP